MHSDFIDDWVKIGLPAKTKVLKEYPNHDFKEQCKFCEMVSHDFNEPFLYFVS